MPDAEPNAPVATDDDGSSPGFITMMLGWVLLVVGALIVMVGAGGETSTPVAASAYGSGYGIRLPDQVSNLSLMQRQTVMVLIGLFTAIGGLILIAAAGVIRAIHQAGRRQGP